MDQFFNQHSICMHTKYTICFKSYKDGIDGLHDDVVRVPRAVAEHSWGGRNHVAHSIENGKCCLRELGGIEFVEWADPAEDKGRKKLLEMKLNKKRLNVRWRVGKDGKVIAAMFDEAMLDWNIVECSEIGENGIVVGELNRRLSKAVEAMEKACKLSEKRFLMLRGMKDLRKLSSEGTEAMQTLFDNIKARLNRAHRYIICCNAPM